MHGAQRQGGNDGLDSEVAERLSRRLRMARRLRGLTLKALADVAGCSESLLSKVENGKACPSLAMLDRLSQALDTSIGWFFDERDPAGPPIPRSGRATAGGPAVTVEATAPGDGFPHADARRAGGQIEVVIGDCVHALRAGDVFAFRSDQPHSFRLVGVERASLFWVETSPPI